jgi:hypothetical protein
MSPGRCRDTRARPGFEAGSGPSGRCQAELHRRVTLGSSGGLEAPMGLGTAISGQRRTGEGCVPTRTATTWWDSSIRPTAKAGSRYYAALSEGEIAAAMGISRGGEQPHRPRAVRASRSSRTGQPATCPAPATATMPATVTMPGQAMTNREFSELAVRPGRRPARSLTRNLISLGVRCR